MKTLLRTIKHWPENQLSYRAMTPCMNLRRLEQTYTATMAAPGQPLVTTLHMRFIRSAASGGKT